MADICSSEAGDAQSDGQLGSGHNLRVCAAHCPDDVGWVGVLGLSGQPMPFEASGENFSPRKAGYSLLVIAHLIVLLFPTYRLRQTIG
jgi:hypothetical protein